MEVYVNDNEDETEETKFECEVCYKAFKSKAIYNMHMMIHSGEKPYECSTCHRRFTQASTLQGHVRTHTGDRPYSCSYCKTAFATRGTRNRHEKTHLPKNKTSFKCDFCDKSYSRQHVLNEHQNKEHFKEMSIACEICNEEFLDSRALMDHMSDKHQEQTSVVNMYMTMLDQTTEREPADTAEAPAFQCSLCPQKFHRMVTLNRHEKTHIKDRNFECDECGKKFIRKSTMKSHMLIHLQKQDHVCEVCSKAFRFKHDLKVHAYLHNGYPFHCHICSKGFSKNVYLNKHLGKSHAAVEETVKIDSVKIEFEQPDMIQVKQEQIQS